MLFDKRMASILKFMLYMFVLLKISIAEPLPPNLHDEQRLFVNSNEFTATCVEQLTKYRKFLLQAILSFEDVCDGYNTHLNTNSDDNLFRASSSSAAAAQHDENLARSLIFRHIQQTPEQRMETWVLLKLLMAQFNDLEFTNIIRDAVIERCHVKSQQQHDEKRGSVVLGKKQRFHSWGGKRNGPLAMLSNSIGGNSNNNNNNDIGVLDDNAERTIFI